MINNFEDLGLDSDIIRAITELGFEKPTPVQEKITPLLLNTKRDIVSLAQTGTGKTAAFGLPVIQEIDINKKGVQVLILSPTRELCRQIAQDLTNYSRYYKQISIVSVYGGAAIDSQIKALRKGCQIIVATPGRILDLINRGEAALSGVKTLVLDEADEMLNMGFKDELDAILDSVNRDRRTLLFSATLPIEVEGIAKGYMKNPEIITVGQRNSGSDNVKHYYYIVQAKDRYSAMKRIIDYYPDIYGIVFCRTRQETQEIADSLIKDGYNADALHGELSQNQRDQVMRRFKKGGLSLLVATDVAARGIDVNNLSHVINYNLPDDVEQYTHRSGRTGRAHKTGISIAIVNTRETSKIKSIEKIIKKEFAFAKIPSGPEVCSKQLLHLISKIDSVEVNEEIKKYLPLVYDKWNNLTREEIIEKTLSMQFNHFLDYYKHAEDLNVKVEKSREEKKKGAVLDKNEKGFKWLKFNIGYKQNITPRNVTRLLSACNIKSKNIGKIEIQHNQLYVSVSERSASYIIEVLNGSYYKGKKLQVSQFRG